MSTLQNAARQIRRTLKEIFNPEIERGAQVNYGTPFPYLKLYAIEKKGEWRVMAQYTYMPDTRHGNFLLAQCKTCKSRQDAIDYMQKLDIENVSDNRVAVLRALGMSASTIEKFESLKASGKSAPAPKPAVQFTASGRMF